MKLGADKESYFEQLSQKLEQSYCINFDDTGYSEAEWLQRFGDLAVDEAIAEYAQKYDLTAKSELLTSSFNYKKTL
ncbi:hypothetical protein H1D31_16465 [Alishewanella sp. BS5-314]|uniref:hypothetical protein n=1 Tax=Alishewanella sp. BS5-314 TaxID=2755587 RepID=UPI0021BAA1B0|nr:hypothetical protein [Alishewanella sp. BS5-314]MCT8127602.1 hypothetical protein [Alishewanella sp. BS5-314]